MIRNPSLTHPATAVAVASLFVSSIAACTTTRSAGPAGPTGPLVRQSVATAPTDLQLLCASEAANRIGADGSRVLPTASSVLQPNLYRVELNVAGTPASCIIDEAGTIHSIEG